jgi:hypothetical protein
MIPPSFKWFSQTCGYDADAVASHGVVNKQESAFHHAEDHKPLFAFVLAIIGPFNAERILENIARRLESNAMLAEVPRRFDIVPFEIIVNHDVRLIRSQFNG